MQFKCDEVALRTICVKFKNQGRVSVFRLLTLQQKLKLGCTKLLTGLHVTCRLRVGHTDIAHCFYFC